MARKKSKSTPPPIVEATPEPQTVQKQLVKEKKIFSIPKGEDANESKVSGEYPLRTYEMFRNKFVGIS